MKGNGGIGASGCGVVTSTAATGTASAAAAAGAADCSGAVAPWSACPAWSASATVSTDSEAPPGYNTNTASATTARTPPINTHGGPAGCSGACRSDTWLLCFFEAMAAFYIKSARSHPASRAPAVAKSSRQPAGPPFPPGPGPRANAIVPSTATSSLTRAKPLSRPMRLRRRSTVASITTMSPGCTGRR